MGGHWAAQAGVTSGRETEEACHALLASGPQWPLASNIAADDMTTHHNPSHQHSRPVTGSEIKEGLAEISVYKFLRRVFV